MVIEAIFENIEAKHALLSKLESVMKTDAVLATNTSSLKLEDLRTPLLNPARLVGIHFFNPVARMPLVEVISAEGGDPEMSNYGEDETPSADMAEDMEMARGPHDWTTYAERLQAAGVSWKVYQFLPDNFTDNPLAGFRQYRAASNSQTKLQGYAHEYSCE